MKNFRPMYLKRTFNNKQKYMNDFYPVGISRNKVEILFDSTMNTYNCFEEFVEKIKLE